MRAIGRWLIVALLVLPTAAQGARVYSAGLETNNGGVQGFFGGGTSGAAIATSPVHGGTYAYKVLLAGSAIYSLGIFAGPSAGISPAYVRVYVYFVTFPTAANRFLATRNYQAGNNGWFTIDDTGTIRTYDEDSIYGGTTQISTGQWYRLEFSRDVGAAEGGGDDTLTARINGVEFSAASNRTTTRLAHLQIGGNIGSPSEAHSTGEWYFDDIAVNDSTGSYQNSWPGEGKLVIIRPTASVTYEWDTQNWVAGTTNNYTKVNEVTPDGQTGWVVSGNDAGDVDDVERYTMGNPGIAADATINHVAVHTQLFNYNGTADATTACRVRMIGALGTVLESANIVRNSANPAPLNAVTNFTTTPMTSLLQPYPNDPDGNPWTTARLDGMDLGLRLTVNNVYGCAVSALFAQIDYTEAANTPTPTAMSTSTPTTTFTATPTSTATPTATAPPHPGCCDCPPVDNTPSWGCVTPQPTVNQTPCLCGDYYSPYSACIETEP